MSMVEACARPIDLIHLARQTLGDRELEREILALFVRQSVMLSARIHDAIAKTERKNLAHTLKGSARAVGAWRVAQAAEAVEMTLDMMGSAEQPVPAASLTQRLARDIGDLTAAIQEANALIADLVPA